MLTDSLLFGRLLELRNKQKHPASPKLTRVPWADRKCSSFKKTLAAGVFYYFRCFLLFSQKFLEVNIIAKDMMVNDGIRARELRVIDNNGEQIGVQTKTMLYV